jgi:hypothetical protein
LSAVVIAIEDALLHRLGDGYQLAAINLSFGGGAFEGPCDRFATSYANAVTAASEADVTIVASSGNEGMAQAIAAPACVGEVLSVASVWDIDSGWVGYSFCLDPECASRCDDSFRPAGAITCYSNTSPVLDLLAPSEYLRAARANGQTIDFGGTSGAAAYASGAVELLRQAAPELEPGAVRELLQLSGDPTLDPRTGLVRPRLNLERALAAGDRLHASAAASNPSRWTLPTRRCRSCVDQPGLIGSVGSSSAIHSTPERLEIALRHPRHRARLHHHGSGSIPGSGDAPHQDGSGACFPANSSRRQPRLFAGELAAGSWRLRSSTGPGPGDEFARLVGWALSIETTEPLSPDRNLGRHPGRRPRAGRQRLDEVRVRIYNPSADTRPRPGCTSCLRPRTAPRSTARASSSSPRTRSSTCPTCWPAASLRLRRAGV